MLSGARCVFVLEKMFGKIKQKSYSQSISNQGTTTSINEKMDNMIPAGKISNLRTGEMVGMIAGGEENETEEYKTSAFIGASGNIHKV